MPASSSNLSRRGFLAGASATGVARSRAAAAARPNILWIIAEDFSPDLGCYGNKLVHTPNLDRLAAEGVRFERAFVTGPVCSASRSAIATGMYQTSIGAHHHRSHRNDGYRLPAGIEVFTHYFRQAGYHTSNVITAAPGVRGTGKTDFNFTAEKPFDGTDWNQRRQGQPFYAQVNFQETHRAFRPFPERRIDPAKIELPPCYPDHPAVREDWALYLETAQHLDVKVGKVLERLRQEGLADDTIVIFFGDHGRPMPRGKQFCYEEGTRIPLIVRIPEKYRPAGFVPGSVRRDLVSAIDITATSLKLAGIDPPAHMEGRVFIGPGAQGRDYIVAARDRCDETTDRIRCVRTARYRYIRNFFPERPYTQPNNYKDTAYPPLAVMRQLHEQGKLTAAQAAFMAPRRPAEELYDLETDPYEIRNLAGSRDHQKTLAELRGILNAWIKQTGDKGEIPEERLPEEEYKYRTQVDGWATRPFARATKSNGLLQVRCEGRTNSILRTYVTEGGQMTLRFRARSTSVRPDFVFWNTIDAMGSRGSDNRAKLSFAADGQWHECEAAFQVQGRLAVLGLELGEANGVIEIDWIRLYRRTAGQPELVREWNFA